MHRSLSRKISILVGMNTTNLNKNLDGIRKKLDGLRKFAGSAFRWVSIGAVAAVGSMGFLLKSVVQTGAQFEKFKVQLSVLFGTVEKAEEKFNWIKEFAKATPYELPQIVDATVKLKATGLEAENVLRDLGDLASSAQKPLEQVVMAVSNIASGMLGIGMKQLRLLNINNKMMEEQGIIFNNQGSIMNSATEVIAAVQRVVKQRFSGMMEVTSKTLSGVITNIKDAWTQAKGLIAERINPAIKKELEKIRDWGFAALNDGTMEMYADKIGKRLVSIFNSIKEIFPKVLEAAKTFWDFIAPKIKWLIENPGMVKNAAILLVMGKLTKMTLAWGSALKGLHTFITVKLVSALGMLATRMGAVAAAVPVVTGAAEFGGIGGAASASGATVAGIGALSTIVPIVLGVLGTAAVGYAIYKLVDKKVEKATAGSLREKMSGANSKISSTRNELGQLTELTATYDRLRLKTNRTASEQTEYNAAIEKLSKIAPDAVTRTNALGEAAGLSSERLDNAARSMKAFIKQQEAMIQLQTQGAFNDFAVSAKKFGSAAYGTAVENLKDIEAAQSRVSQKDFSKGISMLFGGEEIGIMSERMTQVIDEQKSIIAQLSPEYQRLMELGSIFYDTSQPEEYNRVVKQTSANFAQLLKLYQMESIADKSTAVTDNSATAKQMENVMKSEEALTNFQKTMRDRQAKIDEAYFNTSVADLNEFDQKRRAIERQYTKDMESLRANTSIYLDHGSDELQSKQDDLASKLAKTNDALSKAQTSVQNGSGPDSEVNGLKGELERIIGDQQDLYDLMRNASENYQKAKTGFSQQKTASLGLIDNEESVDWTKEKNKKIASIEEDLQKKQAKIAERTTALQLASHNQYYQGYMAIVREGETEAARIMQEYVDGKIGMAEAVRLAHEATGLSRQEATLTTLEETAALENEILEVQQAERLHGYETDYSTREEWAFRANELLSTLREEDFTNYAAYLEAKQKLEGISEGKSLGLWKANWKFKKKLRESAFMSMFKAGQIWAKGELNIQEAVKVATLQSVSDTVSGYLEYKGKMWAIEAAAAAAKLDFGRAAGLAASATAAGIASGWVKARAQESIDAITDRDEEANEVSLYDSDDSAGATRHSGYTTSGVRDIYIQPSTTFNGENIFLGSSGVEESGQTIGDMAVDAVREAINTGELDVSTIG